MAVSEQTVVTGAQLDQLSINTIRTLAIDAVQQANSGHPGAPMGLAPVAYALCFRTDTRPCCCTPSFILRAFVA